MENNRIGRTRSIGRLGLVAMALVACVTAAARASDGGKAAATRPAGAMDKPVCQAVIQLWPGDAPDLVTGGRPEKIVNERYVDVSVPQLFVYLPPRDKASGTALIICAGGGYGHLAMGLHVENVVKLLNDQGIAVFGLKYRTRYGTNDVVKDALADGKRAVRLVRSRAKEWGIDPARVGVQGYSAGANLCLNLAGRFDAGDAQAADPVERLGCRPDFVVLMCPWPNRKTIEDYPLNRNSPPTFIANARDDKTAPVTFALAIDEKLKGLGVTEELFLVETGGHGAFHYGVSNGPGVRWPEALMPWLRKIAMLK